MNKVMSTVESDGVPVERLILERSVTPEEVGALRVFANLTVEVTKDF